MNEVSKMYSSIVTVAVVAIRYLLLGDEKRAVEILFYLHPDKLETLAEYADKLNELCTSAISDYPDPDIGDE